MNVYDEVWARYKRVPVRGEWARKLRSRLQAAGISQGQLSRESGYDASHVSRWLGGRVEPALEAKLVLDEAFDRLTPNGADNA